MSSPEIKHVVVVMLENRSYDNMLGWLYNGSNEDPYKTPPPGQSDLQGLTGTETNPSSGGTVTISNAVQTTVPAADPGELFCDMAQQVYNAQETSNPYVNPPPSGAGAMQGFVNNYALQKNVDAEHVGDCMTYFTPTQVPVTAWLARNFAVCDQWYGSAPCQTFTNRVFSLCASPAIHPKTLISSTYSLIDDLQYVDPILENLPSIFSQLQSANWKLYYHDYSIAATFIAYINEAAGSSTNTNVAPYDNTDWGPNSGWSENPPRFDILRSKLGNGANITTFMQDLAAGNLPMLSVIEPRYSSDWAAYPYPPNSNHPGNSKATGDGPPTDVADGEVFLGQLYNALQSSPLWANCLLIVTYDEHGGMYDHLPPAAAPAPGANQAFPPVMDPSHWLKKGDPTADGFSFNYYGPRVPTIIVSPFVSPGSQITSSGFPFDHCSIVRTVWDCFNLGGTGSLTYRDANAPSLYPQLTGSNTIGQCPFVPQAYVLVADSSEQVWSITASASGTLIAASATGSPQVVVLQDTAVPANFYQLTISSGVPAIIAVPSQANYAQSINMWSLANQSLWIVEVTNGVLSISVTPVFVADASGSIWSITVSAAGILSAASAAGAPQTIVLQDSEVSDNLYQLTVVNSVPAVTLVSNPASFAASFSMQSANGNPWLVTVKDGALSVAGPLSSLLANSRAETPEQLRAHFEARVLKSTRNRKDV
jgi:phospholipase C